MNESNSDRYRAPALDKGLDILELLAGTEESLTQAEIANALDRSPNEIYRMLDRLVRRNFVRRTSGDRFELSLKLFELAHKRPPLARLVSRATPIMRRFALQSMQAVHLVVRDRNSLVVVAQVDGPGYWNVSIRVGSRVGLINVGSGHVFLAYASEEERDLMLEEHDLSGPQHWPPELDKRLKAVRRNGYENMQSLQIAAVSNLSVPIFGPLGTVIAVMTCPFTRILDQPDAPDTYLALEMLKQAAESLSQRTHHAEDIVPAFVS